MTLRTVIDFLVALFWDKLPNLILLAMIIGPIVVIELVEKFSKDF